MRKLNILKRAALLFVALVFSINLYATHEKFIHYLRGTGIVTNASFKHLDDKFQIMQTNTSWQSLFVNKKVTNTITLKYDKNSTTHLNATTSTSVGLEIKYRIESDTLLHTLTTTLNLTYDPTSTVNIQDHDVFVFYGGHDVKVKVTSISGSPGNVMILTSEIDVERYYAFNATSIPTIHSAAILSSEYNYDIELKWPRITGAEEYDLEYVFINDYRPKAPFAGYISADSLDYNFKYNSTHVTLNKNFYRIANTFEHGYLLYRVRGVSRYGANKDKRWNGAWSSTTTGAVGDLTDKLALTTPFMDDSLNWSYQAIYTENGNRFDGVSFSDGLMMGRQNLGRISSDDVTLVQEVYYDHQGRPAVTSLPT